MAIMRSWDSFDYKSLDLNLFFRTADTLGFDDDDGIRFRGTTYDDAIYIEGVVDGFDNSLEFYGSDIAVSGAHVVAGTFNALANWFYDTDDSTWYYNLALTGFSVNATKVDAALTSAGTADDRAVLAQMLSGHDNIVLSADADRMTGFAGSDTLRGGRDDDALLGGTGNDRLDGEAGDDWLRGEADNDQLRGGGGADTLDGGRGNDRLIGGAGDDFFVFRQQDGSDRVLQFEDGTDLIRLQGFHSGTDTMRITQDNDDTLIIWDALTIRLVDIDAHRITGADFG
ncbi:Hemolysin-type calcium-binding repeat-containing protein [Gemmobacter aquatilis]|uniref:Hemolysin-type calcium-binding repeat-containing protein n=1 Tax=Gemmobacter aquatilis TaxID=933059 RepID=A0A1H8EZ78_9RHOB|nr:calcium-binding protein [Gemmobacter aquatilis]SEN24048.1 Hemolysin-type calcium-binding repeat-containing protein [Gemmobacter aquatilis]